MRYKRERTNCIIDEALHGAWSDDKWKNPQKCVQINHGAHNILLEPNLSIDIAKGCD